MFGFEDRTRVG
uniref:Uncharacterized protein n=1 Tax=Anguilla anguilla TaxID=7936 RepID=A0A0E9Q8H1_ANGAN